MTYEELEYLVSMHKSMWKWIAKRIEESKLCRDVEYLKFVYVTTYDSKDNQNNMSLCSYCYLCYLSDELGRISHKSCEFCKNCLSFSEPYNMDPRISKCLNGLYRDVLFEMDDYNYQAKIAMIISELPIDMDKAKQMFGIGGQSHDV